MPTFFKMIKFMVSCFYTWFMQVKAKTISEIHTEAEKNMKLRPGSTASMRNNRTTSSGPQGSLSPGGYPINRPGFGGMMPGMPGTRKMPGMPGIIDNDSWEVPRSRSMPRGDASANQYAPRGQPPLVGKSPTLNSRLLPQGTGLISGRPSALLQGSGAPPVRPPTFVDPVARPVVTAPAPVSEKPLAPNAKLNPDALRRKTISLLEEYFSVRILDEALQCVEELKSPDYHPEFVKESISLALEKVPPCVEPVVKLFEYLLAKKVLTARDIETGFSLYASNLDDIGIDLPKAPNNFGEIIGKLVLSGGLDFKVVEEIVKKMEDDMFQKAVVSAASRIVSSDATA